MPIESINFDQLQVFLRVTETGSFSAAGRDLHRAQSAVSYAIKALEEDLGVELFDRSHRTPRLSEAGEALLSDVRAIAGQVGILRRRATMISEGIEPRVSVVLDSFLPMKELFPTLRRFEETYPDTQLVIHCETLGALPAMVASGRCVLGFGSVPLTQSAALIQQEVASIEMATVVGSEHKLAHLGRVVAIEELQQHAQVVVTDRSALTDGKDHGVYSPRTWRVVDPQTKLALIEAGFGFGSLPSHMCSEGLAQGRLKLLRLQGRERGTFRLPVTCLWRLSSPPGPAAQWLRGEIHERLQCWSSSNRAP